MHKPLIKYLVSSPYGDEPVDKNKLGFPLEGDPLKTPYRIYFDSIRDFLTREGFKPLLVAVNQILKRGVLLKEISEIIIRTEKHGALCHPASIELILKKEKVKFGLNIAVTDTGRGCLQEEFSVLKNLQKKYDLSYLPKAYLFDNLRSMSFLLEEWFEGYHEFHIATDEKGGQRLKLWEFGKGYKYLSSEQSFDIYRQASKILTLYYDVNDFYQIYPWHHAAGDFVARVEDNVAVVRLTTARQYEPYMTFQEKEDINPVIALFYFLLNLTVRMRLDKLDGVGDTVWAKDYCLEATMKGFIEGLRLKDELKDYLGSEYEFLRLLKSFRLEDIKTAYSPLIELYKETGDYPVITGNIDRHVKALHTILQNFPS